MKVTDQEFLEWLMIRKVPVSGWRYPNGQGVLAYHSNMDSCLEKPGLITQVRETWVSSVVGEKELKDYTYLLTIKFSPLQEYIYYGRDIQKGLRGYPEEEIRGMLDQAGFWARSSRRFGL